MALDPEDITKLDRHIVEPLLNAVDALGLRFDLLGDRIERANAALADRIVRSNEDAREANNRVLERLVQLNEEILSHKNATLEQRIAALEQWRASLDKKH